MAKDGLDKYLRQHAEPEVQDLKEWPLDAIYQQVVVIPAFDESPLFMQRLVEQFFSRLSLLAIIVVNRPDNVHNCPANEQLLSHISQLAPHSWQSDDRIMAWHPAGNSAMLSVNRHLRPIPAGQGVGTARKLGADLACALIQRRCVTSRWIHSTDADALLPDNYFAAAAGLDKTCVAGCFDFTHIDDGSEIARATARYEQHLRHYRDGLRFAGSPYGFFTIGSAIAFDYRAYATAHGFPKRPAGEDFYLLNKLAKLGEVASLQACIKLQPRPSHRVPFGTGPASVRILQTLRKGEPVCSYHPDIFLHLRGWLRLVERCLASSGGKTLQLTEECLRDLHPQVIEALHLLRIEVCAKHLNQTTDVDWRRRHFHAWFDALRTLRFVHHLQRHGFEDQPLPEMADK